MAAKMQGMPVKAKSIDKSPAVMGGVEKIPTGIKLGDRYEE